MTKNFISYATRQPIAMDKVKTFIKKNASIIFFFEAGQITWDFGTVEECEFVYESITKEFVKPLVTVRQTQVIKAKTKINIED